MSKVRHAAVAGTFYPDDPQKLRLMIEQLLFAANEVDLTVKAIIAPHAGYIYSGPIAASAYKQLTKLKQTINRVVVIGPAHRLSVSGLAVDSATIYTTPLGHINIDTDAVDVLKRLPFVDELAPAFDQEHSLEVQLPFLQVTLGSFELIPILAGNAKPEDISTVLKLFWGLSDTLIVISSDLSHFHDYATAQKLDAQTSQHIENLQYQQLDYDCACGRVPISGLLALAQEQSLTIKTLDLRNSGDTAGDKSGSDKNRVVGYGAYVVV